MFDCSRGGIEGGTSRHVLTRGWRIGRGEERWALYSLGSSDHRFVVKLLLKIILVLPLFATDNSWPWGWTASSQSPVPFGQNNDRCYNILAAMVGDTRD